jgi:hypothetical protein
VCVKSAWWAAELPTCPSNQINFTFTIADDTLLLGLAREVAVCGCRESCQPREGRA